MHVHCACSTRLNLYPQFYRLGVNFCTFFHTTSLPVQASCVEQCDQSMVFDVAAALLRPTATVPPAEKMKTFRTSARHDTNWRSARPECISDSCQSLYLYCRQYVTYHSTWCSLCCELHCASPPSITLRCFDFGFFCFFPVLRTESCDVARNYNCPCNRKEAPLSIVIRWTPDVV